MSAAHNERCEICGTLLDRAHCLRCGGRIARPDLLGPPRRLNFIAEFALGVGMALRGARMTLTSPKLLSLVILPVLLNLGIFAASAWLLFTYRTELLPAFLEDRLGVVGTAIGGVLAVIAGFIAAFLLSSVVNAPFLELLSECVETRVFDHGDERPVTAHYVWNVWIVPLLQAVGVVMAQGFAALLVLALSLTGVLAPLVAVAGVWLIAITLCDVVVARKRYPIRARFTLVNRALPLHLGVALPFALLPYLLPFGVAGATCAYLRDRRIRGGLA